MHADVSRLKFKFGRIHHEVDYRKFNHNRPKLKKGVKIEDGIDDYGIKLKKIKR